MTSCTTMTHILSTGHAYYNEIASVVFPSEIRRSDAKHYHCLKVEVLSEFLDKD